MKKILAVILTGIIAVSSITMVSAATEKRLIGDVNNDGAVSIEDATDIQKYLAYIIDLDDEAHICADTDGNGAVSIEDATTVQKYLARIISDFPANQPDVPTTEPMESTTPPPTEPTTESIEPTTPPATEPESENPVVGNVIPEGGQVIFDDITYNAGEEFPEIEDGMIFTYGDYEYVYNGFYSFSFNGWVPDDNQNGWGIRVQKTGKTLYSEILGSINNAPVVNMSYTFYNCTFLTTAPTIPNSVKDMTGTFYGCTSLTTAPTIPNSVKDMTGTFYGCTSLTTVPTIPNSVTNMSGTFYGCTSLITAPTIPNSVTAMTGTFQDCTSLTGEVEINASNLDYYDYCFDGTKKPITLTGTCPILDTIASQHSNVSIFTSVPESTQPVTKPTATPNEMELEILRLVNVERTSRGIKPLKFGDFFYEAAKVRAKEIDTHFAHIRPDGRDCVTAVEEIGIPVDGYRYAGENCARYYNSTEAVMNDFMNSYGHRFNIICPEFDYLAVAVYESKEYPGYYTVEQLFLSDEIDWDNYG